MKQLALILLIAVSIISCKKDDLTSEFDCSNSSLSYEMKEYKDVLKKFKVNLPSNWKTQMYYDDFQSQISSADTTKSIKDTYILELTWHQGELNLDDSFAQTVADTLAKAANLKVTASKFTNFQEKPSFYSISEGKQGNYNLKNLQLYIKTEPDEYITLTTKVYGDENVNERFCEAIEITKNIQIN